MLSDKNKLQFLKWFIPICKKVAWLYFLFIFIWLYLLIRGLKWFVWDFTSLRFIINKSWKTVRPPINPDTGKRPPSTFIIWVSGVISIYIAFFSIASQRYESRVDVIENRANSVFAQLSIKEIRAETLSRLPAIQRMSCPYKPSIWDPISILKSLFFKDVEYPYIVQLMKDTLVIWKKSLSNVDFTLANLKYTNFNNADFSGADFNMVNLSNTVIENANFNNAKNIPEWVKEGLNEKGIYQQERLIEAIQDGYKNLYNANLYNADLSKANLSNAFLNQANLIRVNLSETDLSNTKLYKANLQGADIQNANLYNAGISKANLSYAVLLGANLTHANLSDSNLTSVDLSSTVIENTIFENAKNIPEWIKEGLDEKGVYKQKRLIKAIRDGFKNLCNANLEGAILSESLLIKANLTAANLKNSMLQNANFKNANLSSASLINANLQGANLRYANLEYSELYHVNLSEADIQDANLRNAYLYNANLKYANLKNAALVLTSACLSHTVVENANFKNVFIPEWIKVGLDEKGVFKQDRLVKAIQDGFKNLQCANLESANLENFNLQNVNFKYANLSHTNLENANFENATNIPEWIKEGLDEKGVYKQDRLIKAIRNGFKNLKCANLENANLQNSNLQNANLKYANLSHTNLENTNLKNSKLQNANLFSAKGLPECIKERLNNKGIYKESEALQKIYQDYIFPNVNIRW